MCGEGGGSCRHHHQNAMADVNGRQFEAKFIYWPLSNEATKKTLEIINADGYSYVDLSPLVTDVYAYSIEYRIKDPRLDKREHLPLFTECFIK